MAGVGGGEGEEHLVAGVGIQGRDRVRGELAEVLVGQDQRHPQSPRLGQGVFQADGQVQEAVALIHHDRGVSAVVFGRAARAPAACSSAASSSDPVSRTVSSPRAPLGSLASRMPPSRMASRLKVDAAVPNSPAVNRRDSTARSFDSSGPASTDACAAVSSSHQAQNPASVAHSGPAAVRARRSTLAR